MNIQQIRNATVVIEYAGKKIFNRPYFGEKKGLIHRTQIL